jgi:glycosyltransferase involved in cell wall biosynthesis
MAQRWQSHGAKVTAITAMPNRRIPGRGEGGIDPRYRGKWFLEENWDGIRTLRSWLYTGDGRGLKTKLINNFTFMVTGFAHALAKRDDYDVIIASSPPFLPHVSGAALARLRSTPLVLEIRDLWPDYLVAFGMLENRAARRALFSLERWLLAQAARVVVVTNSFRDRVVAKGVARERIEVIPNGVALDHYFKSREAAPRPELTRTNDELVVGYLGTFGKGQGLQFVVRAAAQLAECKPQIRFVLVGDGPERQVVADEISRTGARNVTVLPPIARDQTRAFYNACDVCLVPLAPIPIFNETVPSKIFEVMACERPLVACVSGEGGAIVEQSRGGIRTDPGDANALAAAILAIRDMPASEREAMGRRARQYVAAHYDRVALADRYLEILKSVSAREPARL